MIGRNVVTYKVDQLLEWPYLLKVVGGFDTCTVCKKNILSWELKNVVALWSPETIKKCLCVANRVLCTRNNFHGSKVENIMGYLCVCVSFLRQTFKIIFHPPNVFVTAESSVFLWIIFCGLLFCVTVFRRIFMILWGRSVFEPFYTGSLKIYGKLYWFPERGMLRLHLHPFFWGGEDFFDPSLDGPCPQSMISKFWSVPEKFGLSCFKSSLFQVLAAPKVF